MPVATCSAAARQHQLHRRSGQAREARGDHNLGAGAEFRAEAAAQVLGYHAHLVGRQVEEHGQVVAHGEDALGRTPDGEPAVGPARNRAVGLERDVRLHRRGVERLVDGGGFAKAARDVAHDRDVRLGDVGAAAENLWRPGGHRLSMSTTNGSGA